MAENDAMEGKDLAIKEKQEFEEQIMESIKDLKMGQTTMTIGGIQISRTIGGYTMSLKEIDFGIIDVEGNFKYNKKNFAEIKKALEEEGITLEELGLPDIEQWVDEKEQEEQEVEREEQQKDEKELSDDLEEKEDNEEQESEDKNKEEFARKHNVKSSQVVHISMDRRITDKDDFTGLVKWSKGYKDIYVLPGKDEYSWETIGINKDGEEEIIQNNQPEGKNPDVTIKRVDGDKITEVRPIAIYQIDDKQSYAVVRDSSGKPEMLYCRQEEGDGKAFWGIGIPEADTKNVREKSVEGREFMDSRNNSGYDLSKKGKELEIGKDLEERGIPSKNGDGVQPEEIDGTSKQNRQMRKEEIIEDLLKRDGIIDRAKAMPGFYENKAEKVLSLMENNDKITYEEAVAKVENSGRSQDGRTPDQGPRKRDH